MFPSKARRITPLVTIRAAMARLFLDFLAQVERVVLNALANGRGFDA